VGDTEKENNQKKPAHPGNKSPERLASNSPFHIPLRRTSCVPPVWPHITVEALSLMGEACYERTDITRRKTVKEILFHLRM
jgi:hypothetical protein